jgi:hypothetical protein
MLLPPLQIGTPGQAAATGIEHDESGAIRLLMVPEANTPGGALIPAERKQLAADIFYLNMTELQAFCDAHAIPYMIHMERADGRIVQTRDTDRKGVIIDRILHFLSTGQIKPRTVFGKSVISSEKRDHPPNASDKVLYRSYKNHNVEILNLMKRLTAGKFEFGAVAQEVLRACWSRNVAPTYHEFAQLWIDAAAHHSGPNPEWAFLSDRAQGRAGPDWKGLRTQKAAALIAILKKIK